MITESFESLDVFQKGFLSFDDFERFFGKFKSGCHKDSVSVENPED